MLCRSQLRLSLLAMSLVLVCCSLTASGQKDTTYRGRKYKTPLATARIEITVLRDVNGKPIENAAVIFHPIAGEVSKGNMELKTNEDGKTVIDVLPMGDTVRLQIIAKGFQTYGEDFKVDKSEFSKEIRLKRPGEQYSIYKDHPEANGGDKGTDSGKPANAPAEAGKADGKAGAFQDSSADSASKDKPAAKPDTQPSQSQPPK